MSSSTSRSGDSGAVTSFMAAELASAMSAIPASSSPEEAYKAFMDKLGEGFTESIAKALGAAMGALSTAHTANADPRILYIAEYIAKGCVFKLGFSTPGLTTPSTEKVSFKMANASPATGSASTKLLGGSVGVTGSYSF